VKDPKLTKVMTHKTTWFKSLNASLQVRTHQPKFQLQDNRSQTHVIVRYEPISIY